MKLSLRLQALVSFADPCRCLADIGTDHGYVPIQMLKTGKASAALACDVRPGPLERARKNVEEAALSDRIKTRLGSGLEVLEPGEADEIVIAGMGGLLIREILEKGRPVLKTCEKLILSPHTDADVVRAYLYETGFFLTDETMVKEDEKFYVFLKAEKKSRKSGDVSAAGAGDCGDDAARAEEARGAGKGCREEKETEDPGEAGPGGKEEKRPDKESEAERPILTEAEKLFGPVLLKKRPDVFLEYIRKEKEKEESRLSEIRKALASGKTLGERSGKTAEALCEKEKRLSMLREILEGR